MKYIALVDCDSFFVSCERKLNPELNGLPVSVVSGERGCVIARSREAKKLGVPMGIPLFQACVEDKNGIRMIPLYNNPFAELVESDIPEPTEHVNTKSDSSVSGLPKFTNSSNAKKWEIIQTTQEMVDYKGNTVEKGIYASSRTDPVGKPVPAGNPPPSLRIGDEHNGNYSVSFDYCIPDKGPLFFMMYDASDTVYANEQLGEEYFWYELLVNGRLNICTTFGKNSKHIWTNT